MSAASASRRARGSVPSFHGYRHTGVSEAIAAGDGIEEVSWQLGHRNGNVTRPVRVQEIKNAERTAARRATMEARYAPILEAAEARLVLPRLIGAIRARAYRPHMWEALLPLLGVALGLGYSLWADWQRRKREAAAQEAVDQRELRRAGRLIREELAWAAKLLDGLIQSPEQWVPERGIGIDEWRNGRETLATLLASPEAWEETVRAYRAIDDANWVLLDRSKSGLPPNVRSDSEKQTFKRAAARSS